MLKQTLTLVAAVVAAGSIASAADAITPIKSQYPSNSTVVLDNLCSFPVTIVQSASVTEIDFFGASGGLTHIVFHVTEQDTFSASEITLSGLPYTANEQVTFDRSGNLVSLYAEGVLENLPLPNGGSFFSAGRVNPLAHPGETVALFPDVGVSGDVGALCSALTP